MIFVISIAFAEVRQYEQAKFTNYFLRRQLRFLEEVSFFRKSRPGKVIPSLTLCQKKKKKRKFKFRPAFFGYVRARARALCMYSYE